MESYLGANLLGPGPRLIKKEFTGTRSHKGWETLLWALPLTPIRSQIHPVSILTTHFFKIHFNIIFRSISIPYT